MAEQYDIVIHFPLKESSIDFRIQQINIAKAYQLKQGSLAKSLLFKGHYKGLFETKHQA